MRMRTTALLALLAASGGAAPAQEKAAPADPALLKSIEAIGTATRSVQSLKSAYLREYTKYGRSGAVVEEGQLLWKRTPEGVVSARWEGKDEEGAILTLVRNGKLSVWRGPKKTSEVSLDEPQVLHPCRFGFPFLPRDWQTAYRLGGPRTSPEFDDRFPEQSKVGIPSVLTFTNQGAMRQYFTRLSLSFDGETGLAWRFRCDTAGWTLMTVELMDWKVNPEIPDSAFEPPRESAAPAGNGGGAPKAEAKAPAGGK